MKTNIHIVSTLLLFGQAGYSQPSQVDTLYFDSDLSSLNMQALETLNAASTHLLRPNDKVYEVMILGYLNPEDESIYNQRLMLRRMQTTRQYLMAIGLDSGKIHIESSFLDLVDSTNRSSQLGSNTITVVTEWKDVAIAPVAAIMKKIHYGKLGTKVTLDENAFAPYPLSDVDIEITEAFDIGSLLSHDWPTITTNGQCLSSAGSVFISAHSGAEEIEIRNGSAIVEIPLRKAFYHSNMALWVADSTINLKAWKSDSTIQLKMNNQLDGFTFVANQLGGYSIESIDTEPAALMLNPILPKKWLSNASRTIHSKGKPITDIYLINKSKLSMIKGHLQGTNAGKFPEYAFQAEADILAFSWTGFELYMAHVPLAQAKYQPLIGRYVLEERDFKRINPARKERILSKL